MGGSYGQSDSTKASPDKSDKKDEAPAIEYPEEEINAEDIPF
jgi:hypothetical protein